ncbi:MAG: hypothetical protein ACQEQM_00245 [Thermoplasmatota archaeon]
MVDWEDIDIFHKYDAGSFALVSGMFMIATATYMIYAVSPRATGDSTVFYYALVALLLTASSPALFYLGTLMNFSDIIGKFSSGITLAIFGTLIYHVTQTMVIERWLYPIPRIFITGILGFITSFLFIRGVAVQLVEQREETLLDEEFEDEEEEFEEVEESSEGDKFLEEEDEPW